MAIYTPKEYLIKNNIVTQKGDVNKQIQRWEKFKHHVKFVEESCPFSSSFSEMVYCIYHGLSQKPSCHMCSKHTSFRGFKKGYSKYCSHKCYWNDLPNYDNNGFGTKDLELRKKYSQKGAATRKSNGSYNFSESHKKKLSLSAKRTIPQKRKTSKERYGVENPGVMGGGSSKAANIYIKKFIEDRNIDIECCYFRDEKLNKKEFFQMIKVPKSNKLKYVQYDLVVFKDRKSAAEKKIKDIVLVLEYNGPWHYTLEQTLNDPYSPSTPYRKTQITPKK